MIFFVVEEWGLWLRSGSTGLTWHCPVSATRDGDRVKDRGHTGMGSVQGGGRITDSLPAAHGGMFPPLPVL